MDHSRKMGPDLRLALEESAREHNNASLTALARIDAGGLSGDRRAELENLGAEVRSEAGDVMTLTLPTSALTSLLALDWVIYVEGSRPLSPEDEAAPSPSPFE